MKLEPKRDAVYLFNAGGCKYVMRDVIFDAADKRYTGKCVNIDSADPEGTDRLININSENVVTMEEVTPSRYKILRSIMTASMQCQNIELVMRYGDLAEEAQKRGHVLGGANQQPASQKADEGMNPASATSHEPMKVKKPGGKSNVVEIPAAGGK